MGNVGLELFHRFASDGGTGVALLLGSISTVPEVTANALERVKELGLRTMVMVTYRDLVNAVTTKAGLEPLGGMIDSADVVMITFRGAESFGVMSLTDEQLQEALQDPPAQVDLANQVPAKPWLILAPHDDALPDFARSAYPGPLLGTMPERPSYLKLPAFRQTLPAQQHLEEYNNQVRVHQGLKTVVFSVPTIDLGQTEQEINGLIATAIEMASRSVLALSFDYRQYAELPELRDAVRALAGFPSDLPELPDQSLSTLTGNASWVLSVAVTPDGRQIVSGSDDGTVKIWDLETGNQVRTLTGHIDGVLSVAVTRDGRQIVSGSRDNTVNVWDLETGNEVRSFSGNIDSVLSVAVTPDGRQIVSGSKDNTVNVWDLETGNQVRTLSRHIDSVRSVAVTPDGRQIVSESKDNTVNVWDLETGNQVRTLSRHIDSVRSVAVTPDGLQIVSGSYDNTVKVRDLETGNELCTLVGHNEAIVSVAVTPDGLQIVSGSEDKTVKVWDLETGNEVRTLSGHTNPVMSVAVRRGGHQIISASGDQTIKIWSLLPGQRPGRPGPRAECGSQHQRRRGQRHRRLGLRASGQRIGHGAKPLQNHLSFGHRRHRSLGRG